MPDIEALAIETGAEKKDGAFCFDSASLRYFYHNAYEAGARAERGKVADWNYLSPEQRAILQQRLNEQMRSMLDGMPLPPPPTD